AFPFLDFSFLRLRAIYHTARRNACKSAKLRCAEFAWRPLAHAGPAGAPADLGACHGSGFSSSCGARKGRIRRPAEGSGDMGADRKAGNAVAESENIVAETAERIFADLA